MLNPLLKKHSRCCKPVITLGLALLITSCATGEIPEESITETSGNPPEETVVSETETPTATEISDTEQSSGMDIETLLEGFEQGTSYAVVRDRLIEAGWVPVEASKPAAVDNGALDAHNAGFTEVTACAGTGAGQCQFNFENPGEQKGLSITTYSGTERQFGDWTIYPLSAAKPTNSSAIAQESRSEIPTQFQGEWNADLAGCGSSVSDGRLVIEPNQLQFYESVAIPSEILVTGDLEVAITAEYSAEGDVFTETDSFKLSGDYSALTHLQTGAVRYRCSS